MLCLNFKHFIYNSERKLLKHTFVKRVHLAFICSNLSRVFKIHVNKLSLTNITTDLRKIFTETTHKLYNES